MRPIRPSSRLAVVIILALCACTPFANTADALTVSAYIVHSRLSADRFDFSAAIADMDAAIALAPDNPALYVERGQRIMLTYEWDRALADYNHALELDPAYIDAYYYRGILYASVPEGINARRLALADFQRYLELAPDARHTAGAERYLELAPDARHTADAERYISEIQSQLDALGSP